MQRKVLEGGLGVKAHHDLVKRWRRELMDEEQEDEDEEDRQEEEEEDDISKRLFHLHLSCDVD